LSKPFEIHPALLALLAVFFVSLTLSLWGGGLIPVFTTITWLVLVGTAGVFLILYALVWLARKMYARHLSSRRMSESWATQSKITASTFLPE
jgi:antibiotic biosynthesis monooxygenase (ABM) superfamily enzyme